MRYWVCEYGFTIYQKNVKDLGKYTYKFCDIGKYERVDF